ncbi:N-acetylmuramoyl-L-alanine amidase [Hydrogenoanaerobacterium saccharovorans]|uniref:N-acetylmuramoyl-L-alanine amidase n=1 Tax=Hydrogenoanaerobacterium saccharovorans TaxID=474960 RepID=A0A1H8BQB0_9FIRM|nr:N-acetylmuramoyl-L-alanine amidase [Hydrogenoanaerobacterium saccharovorans]RPF47288.1 N-acetylmuramoyl-L-alanine amidase [Hydrogenoanaerobacterium saccharovorans]SEM85045.1 N-acetylmuramoyl-L-alanine amidase [Hydrogenoanaerobacterium saccharovorans]
MPTIYLSPSTQENNLFVNGGTEEYYMNLIADAMLPYLRSSGIQYVRNTPEMTAASSIRQSNQGNFDLHVALHSNAAPEGRYGEVRGSDIYYYPYSAKGKRAAEIIANNLKKIYPIPSLVRALPTTYLGEVRLTRAPSVFIELAYHDNIDDANWIKDNIQSIAINIVQSLTQFFGIPFIPAQPAKSGTVNVTSGNLNIRSRPNTGAPIIARAYDGAPITVLGEWQGWYVVNYNGNVGYAAARYIDVE